MNNDAPRTKEDLNGEVRFVRVDGGPAALATFLSDLRLHRHELIAVAPDVDCHIVYYHVRPEFKATDYVFHIHDLVEQLKKLPDPCRKRGLVEHHLKKLPIHAPLSAVHLAEELDPEQNSLHVIGKQEMAAILLRAYYIGREDGESNALQAHGGA